MYLLDSNVCIHLLNNRHSQIEKHFLSSSPSEIALCSTVKAELQHQRIFSYYRVTVSGLARVTAMINNKKMTWKVNKSE